MKHSQDRLLTTHAGSLVRPASIVVAMRAKEAGEPYDAKALAADARQSVAEVVRHQAAAGVDIPSDGEQAKASFFRYLNDRLTGLTPTPHRPTPRPAPDPPPPGGDAPHTGRGQGPPGLRRVLRAVRPARLDDVAPARGAPHRRSSWWRPRGLRRPGQLQGPGAGPGR